jgi:hypothetical protein
MQTPIINRVLIVLFVLLTISLSVGTAMAEDWTLKEIKTSAIDNGYRVDLRHHHNRYYPPMGVRYKSLPPNHRRVSFHGLDYFFYDGAWYRPSGPEYIVVAPPVGLSVNFLPRYYTTIRVGNVPYYYADGVYYVWSEKRRAYVVTNPPPQNEVVEQSSTAERLFIYPKQDQSEQKQASDRYECHTWAKDESGFDPTLAGGGVPAEENVRLREQYNRAMKACLEARGYSVQ